MSASAHTEGVGQPARDASSRNATGATEAARAGIAATLAAEAESALRAVREVELTERLEALRETLDAYSEPDLILEDSPSANSLRELRKAQRDPHHDIVPLLLDALRSGDAEVREFAAENLRRFPSPRAVMPLIPLLRDESPWVRIETAETLGFLRDEAAVPELLRAASDDEPAVRVNVAEALGAIRHRGPEVVQTLIQMLGDSEPVVRAFSAEALGDLGDRTAIAPLQASLPDKPLVRVWIHYALARLGEGLDWASVQKVLRYGDVSARFQAIAVLRLLATERNAHKIADIFRRALRYEKADDLRETLIDCVRDMETANRVPPSEFPIDEPPAATNTTTLAATPIVV